MKKKYVKAMALGLALTMVLGFVGCSGSDDKKSGEGNGDQKQEEKTSVDKIKEKGVLMMGTSADYPPYEFHAMVDGQDTIVGCDIEIGKKIAEELGVELKVQDMSFEGLLINLNEDKYDIVIAGMAPEPERVKNATFSKPYEHNGQAAVVLKKNLDHYNSAEDLKTAKVAVQKGALQEEIADKVVTNGDIVKLVKLSDAITEVKNGKVDAVFMDTETSEGYVSANPDLAVSKVDLTEFHQDKGMCVAMKKGNDALCEVVNKVIDQINADGSFAKMKEEAKQLAASQGMNSEE